RSRRRIVVAAAVSRRRADVRSPHRCRRRPADRVDRAGNLRPAGIRRRRGDAAEPAAIRLQRRSRLPLAGHRADREPGQRRALRHVGALVPQVRSSIARRLAGATCVALAMLAGDRASACQCPAPVACTTFWTADAVFVGTVTDSRMDRVAGLLTAEVHTTAVTERLRGDVDATVTMVPARPTDEQIAGSIRAGVESVLTSSCEFAFKSGGAYLVYARRAGDGRWQT